MAPTFTQEGPHRCKMTQWSLPSCRCLESYFLVQSNLFTLPFSDIFMGLLSVWSALAVWELSFIASARIGRRVKKQWILLPWLTQREVLFVLHGGEPLPVITGAPRCCRQETLCSYKYEACHCCDYSELSATTPHCLLCGVALFCFGFFFVCVLSYRTIEADKAER